MCLPKKSAKNSQMPLISFKTATILFGVEIVAVTNGVSSKKLHNLSLNFIYMHLHLSTVYVVAEKTFLRQQLQIYTIPSCVSLCKIFKLYIPIRTHLTKYHHKPVVAAKWCETTKDDNVLTLSHVGSSG